MANLAWNNTGIPVSYKINGINIREKFGVEIRNHPETLLPSVRQRTASPSLRDGEFDAGSIYANRRFTLNGRIMATTHANVVTQIDNFIEFLQLEDNLQQFALGGLTIRGLMFEVAGHSHSESRYLIVSYGGTAQITNIAPQGHFKGRAYDFTVQMYAAYPFWVSVPYEDVHPETTDNDWLRIPKSGSLGTGPTHPEFQLSGPIGANAQTIASGLFGVYQRFQETTYAASDDTLGLEIPNSNIFEAETTDDLKSRIVLTAVPATAAVGENESVNCYGSVSGAKGNSVKQLIKRGATTTSFPTDSKDTDAVNFTRGTLSFFFKPIWDVSSGASDDERTHTFIAVGKNADTADQFRIRLKKISDEMRLEVNLVNSSGTELSIYNS